ncbi:ATP-dependent protease subunit [Neoasaia chiangmaiensis NBRC 101099]|uniref:AAA family ATPase n=1 Tax=Neoasaia chiangmaiensis TaxID=320497 RepID=A0A1U9KR58_9PROT|nr:ATP-binding protein [Neoasaia chiangmaiensis]AQS88341.1 AAA family ATPase [Neoasaia chiangmaiensis]GBR39493.1 ATP-dependent protease subunit [Neoasaia chiangmaiensis NBRC 101099]GEN14607.1 ATPase AAA [Neoasaia chiangmaiensis]
MDASWLTQLERIAGALERLAPPLPNADTLQTCNAFVWQGETGTLTPVPHVAGVDLALLRGVERQIGLVLENTRHFAAGRPANNVMLWGARGMGKSSLVKAAHARINAETPDALVLIEIQRDDLSTLPRLLTILRQQPRRCIVFCDDLSFESQDADYKSLKSVLDGGIMGRPNNVVFYATSNRRHLMPRDAIENENGSALNPHEAVEEKVSLSDRFGLWIGVHGANQDTYLAMVDAYAADRRLPVDRATLHRRALQWSMERGSRSGRVAAQFIDNMSAELG